MMVNRGSLGALVYGQSAIPMPPPAPVEVQPQPTSFLPGISNTWLFLLALLGAGALFYFYWWKPRHGGGSEG